MIVNCLILTVGHTEKDIVFKWKKPVPIDVNKKIELPQYKLPEAETIGCFNPHWTGKHATYSIKTRLNL